MESSGRSEVREMSNLNSTGVIHGYVGDTPEHMPLLGGTINVSYVHILYQ